MQKLVLLTTMLGALVLATAAVALAQTEPEAPAYEPTTIVGTITSISGAEVLVEADPASQFEGDKGSFTVTEETAISRLVGGDAVAPAAFEELAVGQLVEATYSGPILLSYPSQGAAGSIVILEDLPGEVPVDSTLPYDEAGTAQYYDSAA